jgi:hypothetical protein
MTCDATKNKSTTHRAIGVQMHGSMPPNPETQNGYLPRPRLAVRNGVQLHHERQHVGVFPWRRARGLIDITSPFDLVYTKGSS